MILGVLLWVVAALAIMNSIVWLLVVCVTLFAYRYHAGWLFFLGVMVDGYYGGFTDVPLYAIALGVFAIVVEILKTSLIGVQLDRE